MPCSPAPFLAINGLPVLRRRREELAPFQAAEAIDVRRKSDAFGEKVDAYRAFFLQKAPFAASSTGLSLEQASTRGHQSLCACPRVHIWHGGLA